MSSKILSPEAYRRALSVRDLTDAAAGPHAMQMLVGAAHGALTRAWGCAALVHRAPPVVSVRDNYDRLGYPPDGAARDARYTRYVAPDTLLRTQTSALVPPALELVARGAWRDVAVLCPGLVYRRDTIDRLHVGEPHQLDLWRVRCDDALEVEDLREMIARVVEALLPGREHRCTPAEHPYTERGLQIDVRDGDAWVEIGECGLAHPEVLAGSGLPVPTWSGLAMGLGLDRVLMLRKGIDDIRLLRSEDPRVQRQLLDLEPYRPVSRMPAARRDLSIVTAAEITEEDLGDRVRTALGDRADVVEEVVVVAETPWAELHPNARTRLGLDPGQKNVLLRVVLRDLHRSLGTDEANALRDEIYAAVHEGPHHEWASDRA